MLEETIVRNIEENYLFKNIRKREYKLGNIYYQNDVPTEIKKLLPDGKPEIENITEKIDIKHGNGKPDLTLKFKDINNTIIVIEIKRNTLNHFSSNYERKKLNHHPKKYAVDGVLYYAKYLSQKYNVLAIAISGDTNENLMTNHFLWKKGEKIWDKSWKISNHIGNYHLQKIYDIDIYRRILTGIEIDKPLEQVRNIALDFHKKLRDLGFTEKQKPLFIANLLLFVSELKKIKDQENNFEKLKHIDIRNFKYNELKEFICDNLEKKLDSSNVSKINKKSFLNSIRDDLDNTKIKKNTQKGEENSIYYYIEKLEKKILPIYESLPEKELDPIGEFYHEFIKYSGGDGKGLGIVLTPHHITNFMAKLINTNENSKVLDIACGTGSFLVSAKSQGTKNENIFGIEINKELHNLAIANMIVNRDGKSNIYMTDSFDNEYKIINTNQKLIIFLRDMQINKGLLNPPFSQSNHSELNFVLRILDILDKNGELAVILPLSTAIGTKFKNERKSLFHNHTLKAVFTMPEDLFYPVANTNTCIMIWKAKVPHDINKETFFGIYKNDQFIKDKKMGRIDKNSLWPRQEQEFLNLYKNNEEKIGKTILKKVKWNDEWLAEAYVETDYNNLKENDFLQVIKDYMAFKIKIGDKLND